MPDRDYDLFERLPDGGVLWRDRINGQTAAVAKLDELAANSPNEVFAIHLRSKEIVATRNGKPSAA